MSDDSVTKIGAEFQFDNYYDTATLIAKMMVDNEYSLPEALGVIELAKEFLLESKRN